MIGVFWKCAFKYHTITPTLGPRKLEYPVNCSMSQCHLYLEKRTRIHRNSCYQQFGLKNHVLYSYFLDLYLLHLSYCTRNVRTRYLTLQISQESTTDAFIKIYLPRQGSRHIGRGRRLAHWRKMNWKFHLSSPNMLSQNIVANPRLFVILAGRVCPSPAYVLTFTMLLKNTYFKLSEQRGKGVYGLFSFRDKWYLDPPEDGGIYFFLRMGHYLRPGISTVSVRCHHVCRHSGKDVRHKDFAEISLFRAFYLTLSLKIPTVPHHPT